MTVNSPYSIESNWLKPADYYNILANASKDKTNSLPPVKPQPGELYVYYNNNNHEDWKSDQYRWKQTGTKSLPKNNPLVTCHYYVCSEKDVKLHRRAFIIFSDSVKYSKITLIHYVGENVPQKSSVHGNSLRNRRPHVMTAKSQLRLQKDAMKEKPKQAYCRLACENVNPSLAPVLTPKNPKQVANTIENEKRKKLPSHDDIVGIYTIHLELDGFVKKLELIPHFILALSSDNMIDLCVGKSMFFYDTTFDLGDFYVSILVYKNYDFESEPCIPLAYLVHDRKFAEVHTAFFNKIKEIIPQIVGKIIITDREEGIRKAISVVLPTNQHLFCWNHIQQDVKHWLRKQRGIRNDNINFYVNNTWDILDSDSEEELFRKYNDLSSRWSEPFKNYFQKFLLNDIIKSSKFNLMKHGIYKARSGITINPSESINALLKRFLNRSGVNLQVLTLSLYQLDKFFETELLRGYCDMGGMVLKKENNHLKMNIEDVQFPEGVVPLSTLPYAFEREPSILPSKSETPYTNYSVARMLLIQGKVKHIPDEKVFIVSGVRDKHLVRLFPKEHCSCALRKRCHHIEAVRMSVGLEGEKAKKLKLQDIIKKNRGFRSGKKRVPRCATEIISANNSVASLTEHNASTALSIPTIFTGSQIVKNRTTPKIEKENDDDVIEESDAEMDISTFDPRVNKPAAESTPIHSQKDSDIDSIDSIVGDTFDSDFKQNKCFKFLGKCIYPKDLECLTASSNNGRALYLNETVISTYFTVINHEEKQRNCRLKIETCEAILNYPDNLDFSFQCAFRFFIKRNIPSVDITIIPVVYSSHCTTIIILIKQKLVIYLDSLGGNPPKSILNFLFNLYDNTWVFLGEEPRARDFIVVAPEKIPIQYTGHDCGLYCCLFVEILLTHSVDCLRFHHSKSMDMYRKTIHRKLLNYMRKSKTLNFQPINTRFNRKKLDNFTIEMKAYSTLVERNLPTGQDVLTFLTNIIDMYWDETSTTCNHQNCSHPSGELVCCDWCYHWYHLQCIGVCSKKELDKKYKCTNCCIPVHNPTC